MSLCLLPNISCMATLQVFSDFRKEGGYRKYNNQTFGKISINVNITQYYRTLCHKHIIGLKFTFVGKVSMKKLGVSHLDSNSRIADIYVVMNKKGFLSIRN